ncbi:MAG: hypothetical protein DYG89_48980 [Caldilinea sp. CFX5]|nr:hypothetical protein [Caldilinea sp. CFX5]
MRQQLEKRLQELKAEFSTGQRVLAELEAKQANLRETLLRITGAIQVLEEELGRDDVASAKSAPGANP